MKYFGSCIFVGGSSYTLPTMIVAETPEQAAQLLRDNIPEFLNELEIDSCLLTEVDTYGKTPYVIKNAT